jgi:endonuclease III
MKVKNRYSDNVFIIASVLKRRYKDFDHYNKKNPLDELLFILCSVKRSESVYLRAYKSLKQAFPTYNKLNQASAKDLCKKIAWGGLQHQKSRALKNLMTVITEWFGKPSLAQLRKMSEEECEIILCSLPGVGKKVARCVMLYSFKKRVFPVDTHCWRVSKRLGWIKSTDKHKFCSSRDMDLLQEIIPPKLRLSLHVNMVSLGRDTCAARLPQCSSCPISEYCPKIGVE